MERSASGVDFIRCNGRTRTLPTLLRLFPFSESPSGWPTVPQTVLRLLSLLIFVLGAGSGIKSLL
ncbi:hypothetical protein F2Q69_00014487 [Brassica cretica]|uniref:Uncharacterized protein n=1 Tax=Brassica cretica TaxID=69181 RepID=A0A8S9R2L9_BRACR|nr:hypothetical protein F2Q69_00014487 [Brassica cretica]